MTQYYEMDIDIKLKTLIHVQIKHTITISLIFKSRQVIVSELFISQSSEF